MPQTKACEIATEKKEQKKKGELVLDGNEPKTIRIQG